MTLQFQQGDQMEVEIVSSEKSTTMGLSGYIFVGLSE